MDIINIISKKRANGVLTYEELDFAFNGYLAKKVPDYQMSALLMAITINGLNLEETINLTDIFIKSGKTYEFDKKTADKHSTGGIGDTVTLIVMPILASLNIPVAKMSGRGLGITGGTVDKLEAIPGYKINLTEKEFYEQVKKIGIAVISQSKDIVPLDKAIYALRDVTGTVDCMGLIASSIMSKKIACGASYIVIDIKVGEGAFLKTKAEAKELASWMKKIGKHFDVGIETIITPMASPLGSAIGNALEVAEAIEVLKGKKGRLYDVSIDVAAKLIALDKKMNVEDAAILAKNALQKKTALKTFEKWIKTQGGNLDEIKISDKIISIHSAQDGIIQKISALNCGKLALKLGAGRINKSSKIDYSVGIKLLKHEGDKVKKDEVLAELYVKDYKINLTEEDLELFIIK